MKEALEEGYGCNCFLSWGSLWPLHDSWYFEFSFGVLKYLCFNTEKMLKHFFRFSQTLSSFRQRDSSALQCTKNIRMKVKHTIDVFHALCSQVSEVTKKTFHASKIFELKKGAFLISLPLPALLELPLPTLSSPASHIPPAPYSPELPSTCPPDSYSNAHGLEEGVLIPHSCSFIATILHPSCFSSISQSRFSIPEKIP